MLHTQLKEENCVQNRNWGTINSEQKREKESQKYAYSRVQTQKKHRDPTLAISRQEETETYCRLEHPVVNKHIFRVTYFGYEHFCHVLLLYSKASVCALAVFAFTFVCSLQYLVSMLQSELLQCKQNRGGFGFRVLLQCL